MKTGQTKTAVCFRAVLFIVLFISGCGFPQETRTAQADSGTQAAAKKVPVRRMKPARTGVRQVDRSGNSILYSAGKLEYRPASFKNVRTIFISKRGRVVQIDHENRAYSEGDLNAYCGAVKARIIRVIKNLPPRERTSVSRFLGLRRGPKPPKVVIVNAGPGGLIAGFRTKKYIIKVDGRKYEELWISRDSALVAQQKKMAGGLKNKFDTCMSLAYGLEAGLPSVEQQQAYRKLKDSGWQMKKDFYFKGKLYFDWTVVKLSIVQKIPEKEFLPPHGFKKISMRRMAGSID